MSADDTERLIADIPSELKRLVDADSRTIKSVVQSALWSEYGGHRKGALETRIEEQQNRIAMIEAEIDDRRQELATERQKLESLQAKLDRDRTYVDDVVEEAAEVLQPHQLTADNAALRDRAEKVDLTPEQFLKRVRAHRDGGEDGR